MKTLLLLLLTAAISSYSVPPGAKVSDLIGNDARPVTIKLYPNPSYDGCITVTSSSPELLQFYIFDLEGKLIYQGSLKDNNKLSITGLKKGSYMYNVLSKDESVDAGKIIVK